MDICLNTLRNIHTDVYPFGYPFEYLTLVKNIHTIPSYGYQFEQPFGISILIPPSGYAFENPQDIHINTLENTHMHINIPTRTSMRVSPWIRMSMIIQYESVNASAYLSMRTSTYEYSPWISENPCIQIPKDKVIRFVPESQKQKKPSTVELVPKLLKFLAQNISARMRK